MTHTLSDISSTSQKQKKEMHHYVILHLHLLKVELKIWSQSLPSLAGGDLDSFFGNNFSPNPSADSRAKYMHLSTTKKRKIWASAIICLVYFLFCHSVRCFCILYLFFSFVPIVLMNENLELSDQFYEYSPCFLLSVKTHLLKYNRVQKTEMHFYSLNAVLLFQNIWINIFSFLGSKPQILLGNIMLLSCKTIYL